METSHGITSSSQISRGNHQHNQHFTAVLLRQFIRTSWKRGSPLRDQYTWTIWVSTSQCARHPKVGSNVADGGVLSLELTGSGQGGQHTCLPGQLTASKSRATGKLYYKIAFMRLFLSLIFLIEFFYQISFVSTLLILFFDCLGFITCFCFPINPFQQN